MRRRPGLRLATDAEATAPVMVDTPSPVHANLLGFEEHHFRTLTINVASTLLAALILYALFGSKLRKA